MKLETLIAFSGALSSLLGVPVSINDLLAHTGQIAINNNLSVDSELLPEILRGSPTVPIGPDSPGGGRRLWDADRNLAKRIGVSPTEMNRACRALWGRSFLEERDHRAGPDASSQKRGYITRLIEDELRTALREKAS